MRVTFYIAVLLFLSTRIFAQSPALDPDYIVLDTAETFTGYWANHSVGKVIETVRPIKWDVPEGGVFLNSVDTAGFNDQGLQPTGPFKQGNDFSVFNRALYRLQDMNNFRLIQTHPSNKLPFLVASVAHSGDLYYGYPPIGDSVYSDSLRYWLAAKSGNSVFGTDRPSATAHLNNDSTEDLLIIRQTTDTTSLIGIWYGDSMFYKGDTLKFGEKVIRASQSAYSYGAIIIRSKASAADFNGDGITDIVFFADSAYTDITPAGPKGPREIIYIRGKYTDAGSRWAVDSVFVHKFPRTVSAYLLSDFLYSDGKPDLLLSTSDTIYCIDGEDGFLEKEIVLSQAQLKIPSPAKLDPKNFMGNGGGSLPYWGHVLYDAGNINGSKEHSIATLALYFPDTNSGYAPAYAFIYSGGKAADERVDALYADNSSPTKQQFTNFDTVWQGNGYPSGILIGDFGYTIGGNGKLWYIKGNTNIPHKPDPRWTKRVDYSSGNSALNIIPTANPIQLNGQFKVSSSASGNASLVLRDLLGRAVWKRSLYIDASEEQVVSIGFSGVASGMYVLELTQNSRSVTTRIVITQ